MALLPSGLAGSGSEEEGASITCQEEIQQGKVRGRETLQQVTCQSLTERRKRPKEAQLLALTVVIKSSWPNNRLWSAGTRVSESVLARI